MYVLIWDGHGGKRSRKEGILEAARSGRIARVGQGPRNLGAETQAIKRGSLCPGGRTGHLEEQGTLGGTRMEPTSPFRDAKASGPLEGLWGAH